MQEALSAQPGAPEKPLSEVCGKALKSDLLWRRAMLVLSGYSEKLTALASGASPETAGRLQAALTGVHDDNWIDAEPGQEQAAREAVAKLVNQMSAPAEKTDFEQTVKNAAPHVQTLCSGLVAYLGDQASKFAEIQAEIEKKRAARADRRCAMLDNRPICVAPSFLDRTSYANAFGELTTQEANHLQARDDIASFCAAHARLQSAASNGSTSKDETYTAIVDAVKAVPRAAPRNAPAAESPGEKPMNEKQGSEKAAPEKAGMPAETK